jgi:hypothetical protein
VFSARIARVEIADFAFFNGLPSAERNSLQNIRIVNVGVAEMRRQSDFLRLDQRERK